MIISNISRDSFKFPQGMIWLHYFQLERDRIEKVFCVAILNDIILFYSLQHINPVQIDM